MADRRLGRGLDLLVAANEPSEERSSPLRELPLDSLRPNPFQPRREFEPRELEHLAASIRVGGVMQPILVRPFNGSYQIVSGERRWRASSLAGRQTITALVRQVADRDMLQFALIENLHRKDLDPIEKATAFQRLVKEFRLSHEEIGKQVGLDRSTVANMIRLLELPEPIQRAVSRGTITMGHARALLTISSPALQSKLLKHIVQRGLSVRQMEALVRRLGRNGRAAPKPPDPNVAQVEAQLRRHFGTKVNIQTNGQKGVLRIEFYSRNDLERILRKIGSGRHH